MSVYDRSCDLVSMINVKNDCRRVAAQENGGDGHQGLTPLAIHFRRVAAQDDEGFRSNPRCEIDPRCGINPRCGIDPGHGMNPRRRIDTRRTINPRHATNRRTRITTGLVLSPKGTEVNSQGCKPLDKPPNNTSSNPNGVIVASDRDQSHS